MLFFGVEISQIVIFWVAQNESYFLGVEKISIIFWVNKLVLTNSIFGPLRQVVNRSDICDTALITFTNSRA